ncbi:PD-(D/E)XK nuclease family transposase [Arachidicoccus rhizosphaerae]|uniref:PD-(D/E)XK nuclease family transposase n=1 Tax=Arachidicoccus rhizosphaerae TaxID=551991 RepID=A0A1H4C9C9_9BACT|nr:PD-(D/E)XK nuclease family transposase [Arachidicoccus rhizosphaerae]SEA56977.1 PD-(D/E)XK nuclease family transposase [Arachidicoccus rhizosphaerae]
MLSTPLTPSTFDARSIHPDVVWQDPKTGSVFLTEMQRQRQQFYSQRISLYDAKARTALAVPGSKWDFDQVAIFVLGIADFQLHKQGPEDFLHEYATVNLADPSDLLTGKDFKMLLDLKKAKKLRPDTLSERYKWTFLLNNFHELDKMPDFMKEGYFENVIEIAEQLNRSKMEELMDFFTELHNGDREQRARDKGRSEGRVEGRAEGRAEGKVEGKAEGKVEGELTAIKNFIKNFPTDFEKSAASIAAIFGVEEDIVKPLISA